MQYFDPDEHTYFVRCAVFTPYRGDMSTDAMFAHVEQQFPVLASIVEDVERVGRNLICFTATATVFCEDLAALRDQWETDFPGTRNLITSVQNVVEDGELLNDVLHAEKTTRPVAA